ncbi:MAG: YcxB family protein [Lachnospiraceae bacterium]|nr:YcxB family protein [Lachnospiraceae bacterium]
MITAKVKISQKELRAYLYYSTYHSFQGILSIILGLFTIAAGIYYFTQGNKNGIFFLLIAAVFFIVQPLMIMMQAKMQSKHTVFQKETNYEFDEKELRAWQEGVEPASVTWQNLFRVVRTRGYYFIFTDRYRANIVPQASFTSENGAEEFGRMIQRILPKEKKKGFPKEKA